MAKHAYRLAYLPKYFPGTYVLVTHQGGSYAVRDYSQDRVKRYGSEHFDGASVRELLSNAEDNRQAEPHRTEDVSHWSLLIGRTNKRIGREGGLDLR